MLKGFGLETHNKAMRPLEDDEYLRFVSRLRH
jgi:hypothetical protein